MGVRAYTPFVNALPSLTSAPSFVTNSQSMVVDCCTMPVLESAESIASLIAWVRNSPVPAAMHVYLPTNAPASCMRRLQNMGCTVTKRFRATVRS